jgi:hypothetical protein
MAERGLLALPAATKALEQINRLSGQRSSSRRTRQQVKHVLGELGGRRTCVVS